LPALTRLVDGADVTAVLQQEVSVRLENISRSGCLLMTPKMLRVGTLGRLRIVLDRMEYVGYVRVVHCEAVDAQSWKAGVELVWIPAAENVRDSELSPALLTRISGGRFLELGSRPTES
jgi:PilZ domain